MSRYLDRTPSMAALGGGGAASAASAAVDGASPSAGAAPGTQSAAPAAASPRGRDLRLDFFRGLGLLLIFIDHLPDNFLANFTLRLVAFSDAAEIFVFVSGYAAALAYGKISNSAGRLPSTLRVYRRVWQLYVAHIFIFFVYMAAVSYSTLAFPDQFPADQFSIAEFLQGPGTAVVNALLLRFQPAFLDILPLYIVLLSVFPLVLYGIGRSPLVTLAVSAGLYLATQAFGWRLHGFPTGRDWFFNPFAWQFLFVIGATCGAARDRVAQWVPKRGWLVSLALVLTAVGAVINLTWTAHNLYDDFPGLLWDALGPWAGNKTNLNPVRLINFLALTATVVHFVRPDSRLLHGRAAALVIACGQNSLEVFCLGILLSVLGHFAFVMFGTDWPVQIAVSFIGCALMLGLGQLLRWYKLDDRPPSPAGGGR